mmetsp:Transcript_74592/g.215544  ORF Transcript_74592/g.215544 Transcript_74592/m.215544 type:complete len:129 (-) Transcript_74592:299-685(-)
MFGKGNGNADTSCYPNGGGARPSPSPRPSPRPSPKPSPGGSCTDMDTNCQSWKNLGYCQPSSTYRGYTMNNCKAACGFCSGGGGGASGGCSDGKAYCSDGARSGYCQSGNQYQPFMRQNCKRSCGFCR